MGSHQQFSLRWNNYTQHISSAFDSLRDEDDFVDVTLSCEGKNIKAHQMLLAACSPYFRRTFKGNPCRHPIVILTGVKFSDLVDLIEFMYNGEVNVDQDNLASFLQTAELLQIRGLTDSRENSSQPVQGIVKAAQQESSAPVTPVSAVGSVNNPTLPSPSPPHTQPHISSPVAPLSPPSAKRRRTDSLSEMPSVSGSIVKTEEVDADYSDMESCSSATLEKNESQPHLSPCQMTSGNSEPYIPQDVKLPVGLRIEPADVQQNRDVTVPYLLKPVSTAMEGQDSMHGETVCRLSASSSHHQQYPLPNSSLSLPGHQQAWTHQVPTNNHPSVSQEDAATLAALSRGSRSTGPSQCPLCAQTISNHGNLLKHIRIRHMAAPLRACAICHRSYKTKYSLREHMRLVHKVPPSRPYTRQPPPNAM